MVDPNKKMIDDILDEIAREEAVEDTVSLDEMRDEELAENNYVEGVDNWEEWN